MRPAIANSVFWFRLAALLGVLFTLGHTLGFLTFRPPSSDGQAVWNAMHRVRFVVSGASFSYGDFYVGFGLTISAFQLFSAWLAWWLSRMAARGVQEARPIAWALCLLNGVSLVLAVRYFSYAPAVLSAVSALALGLGAWAMGASPSFATRQSAVTVTSGAAASSRGQL